MMLIQEDEQSSHISHLSQKSGFAKLATSMSGAFLIVHLLQCLMSTESSIALLITKEIVCHLQFPAFFIRHFLHVYNVQSAQTLDSHSTVDTRRRLFPAVLKVD